MTTTALQTDRLWGLSETLWCATRRTTKLLTDPLAVAGHVGGDGVTGVTEAAGVRQGWDGDGDPEKSDQRRKPRCLAGIVPAFDMRDGYRQRARRPGRAPIHPQCPWRASGLRVAAPARL